MRDQFKLNGEWMFRIDREGQGDICNWHKGGFPEVSKVEVPHIWQREEAYVNYCGIAWYEKELIIERIPANKRAYLSFSAVDFHAIIWINGTYIGEHEGGFTPFEFDITDAIIQGMENKLVVRVYDPADNAEIPIGKQGSWYTRVSGIWQDVNLEYRAETYIDHVFIYPNIDEKLAGIKTVFNGVANENMTVTYEITDHLDNTNTHVSKTVFISEIEDKLDLQIENMILWSPENPHLYDLTVKLKINDSVIDSYKTYFGMRKIDYINGQLRLNNQPLYIRGALDQAFYPDTIFVAPSDEWIKNEINLAKDMGFNLLRKHIKIEIPRYLYWADRMGMLIWQEPPNVVKWSEQSNKRFYNELKGMIKRDFNRPSIIIWSIYNEEWGLEWDLENDLKKQSYLIDMFERVKQLDPTRPICDNSGWTHVKTDINDYHRYFTLPEQIQEWQEDLDQYMLKTPESNYVKGYAPKEEPIIVSEFGVWGLPSIEKIVDFYGGYPSWFENLGDDTHREDFKKPLVALENFEKYQLDRVFGDFENLALHSQKRMLRACQSLIEEMRKRPDVNGYVITEFTDIEWETNGWLDYMRNMKEGFDKAARFNGDLVVMVKEIQRNLWSGDEQICDIIISNHDQKEMIGTIEWEIIGTDIAGEININEGRKLHIELKSVLQFVAPQVIDSSFLQLKLRVKVANEVVAENEVELTVSPKSKQEKRIILPYKMESDFCESLQNNGLEITESFEDSELVITSTLDKYVLDYYRTGGQVIFLAEEGDHLAEKGQYTFRQLDVGESWNRASSFNYVDINYFENLPLNKEMGWEFDGLYPDYIVPFSNYDKLGGTIGRIVYMFGNDTLAETSEIISGYFQGWIGQAGGSMLLQKNAHGSLLLTTWKLKESYGNHPIATQILHKLIDKAKCQVEHNR